MSSSILLQYSLEQKYLRTYYYLLKKSIMDKELLLPKGCWFFLISFTILSLFGIPLYLKFRTMKGKLAKRFLRRFKYCSLQKPLLSASLICFTFPQPSRKCLLGFGRFCYCLFVFQFNFVFCIYI